MTKTQTRALRRLYRSSAAAQEILNKLAGFKRSPTVTTVESLLDLAYREDIIEVFKKLAHIGMGEYIIGRRGYPTRFQWDFRCSRVGQAAQPKKSITKVSKTKGKKRIRIEIQGNQVLANGEPRFTLLMKDNQTGEVMTYSQAEAKRIVRRGAAPDRTAPDPWKSVPTWEPPPRPITPTRENPDLDLIFA